MMLYSDTWSFIDEVSKMFNEMSKSKFSSWTESFPPLDILLNESTGVLKLKFALAGYEKNELDITIESDIIRIQGAEAEEEKGWKVIKGGMRKRKFDCKYALPSGKYDATKATAGFKNGILTIEIPPTANNKPTTLLIE